MRPLGAEADIVIDPEVTFGIPQVGGIRTETLAEAFATKAPETSLDELATEWGIPREDFEAALQWELSLTRRAAA